jgi:hypothetical protein
LKGSRCAYDRYYHTILYKLPQWKVQDVFMISITMLFYHSERFKICSWHVYYHAILPHAVKGSRCVYYTTTLKLKVQDVLMTCIIML